MFRIRRLLRRRADRLSPTAWSRLLAGLEAGDRDAQIGRAWIAAQDLRLIYAADTRADAEQRLHRWLTFCADTDIGGVSDGPTEATNLLIKKVKRSGHGFRNPNNYRLRLLLRCGVDWHTQYPAPLRGRLPRLAA